MTEVIDDLFTYNDWANAQVLNLCDGLSDQQLDQPREMGFGSLRATLYHIAAADQVWMERWEGKPWRSFPKDPEGRAVSQIADELCEIAQARCELIERSREDSWTREIEYQDSKQTPFRHRLADLLLHVFNHGVHHRAQALAYLKSFERTTPMGIDYIFYRTAVGTTPQSPEAQELLGQFGMQVGSLPGGQVGWDQRSIARGFEYHDWATQQVLSMAESLTAEQLQIDFGIGPTGTILGTLQHLFDVETWWFETMIRGENQFGQPQGLQTVEQFRQRWPELSRRRDQFLATIDGSNCDQLVRINFGGPDLCYSVAESTIQNLVHGVHHRAQLINMLRHSDAPIENIDLLYAIDKLPPPQ